MTDSLDEHTNGLSHREVNAMWLLTRDEESENPSRGLHHHSAACAEVDLTDRAVVLEPMVQMLIELNLERISIATNPELV
jgi:hypothetical protein